MFGTTKQIAPKLNFAFFPTTTSILPAAATTLISRSISNSTFPSNTTKMASEKDNKSPSITLYSANTPNGIKISIALEELGLPYNLHPISFPDKEQKQPWYLQINPNGRIPAITDDSFPSDGQPIHIFESGAILSYLVETYDKDHRISYPRGSREYWLVQSWLYFQNAGVGPMQGQASHFLRYAPEKIQYGIDRYVNETKRLYSVLEEHLSKPENQGYLVGDKLTIADITHFGWVRAAGWSGIDINEFPKLKEWEERLEARPAVQRGRNIPPTKRDVKEAAKSEKEAEELAKERSALVLEGQRADAVKFGKS